MSIEELVAYLTGSQDPPGSHAADMTLADLLFPTL